VSESYRSAGVDLEAAERAVVLIRDVAKEASRAEVVGNVGGFAGLFRVGDGRVLAAAADGVGTKLEVARLASRLDTVGIDLVAMCADDIACAGAEPLFFLDYIAVGRLVPEEVAAIVEGVAEGCRRAGCALLGGETAEHPRVMADGQFDLAGFCVGVASETALLGPHRVREGDLLVGLSSSGLHCNGYSLVRKVLLDSGTYGLADVPDGLGRRLGEELLEPAAIYAPFVHGLARSDLVSAAAHITGGGLYGNVPRALPEGMGAEIHASAWPTPPVFDVLRREGHLESREMFRTFNMGIGLVLVVPARARMDVLAEAAASGRAAHVIGRVVPGSGVRIDGA
jgi:phosphoribosylformylglycinamidine cyclo-ligase